MTSQRNRVQISVAATPQGLREETRLGDTLRKWYTRRLGIPSVLLLAPENMSAMEEDLEVESSGDSDFCIVMASSPESSREEDSEVAQGSDARLPDLLQWLRCVGCRRSGNSHGALLRRQPSKPDQV